LVISAQFRHEQAFKGPGGFSMSISYPVPSSVKIIRWTARIWSVLATIFLWLILFMPDSSDPGPIAPVDRFFLSLTGLTIIGLMVAWRSERVGSIFTIAMLCIREIFWVILKGGWEPGFIILWVLILPPAILYLVAWSQERKANPSL